MTLRIVPPSPVECCMPWHARGWCTEDQYPATCCFCGRDIAASQASHRLTVCCIYCGMDIGLIPMQEVEPGDNVPALTESK